MIEVPSFNNPPEATLASQTTPDTELHEVLNQGMPMPDTAPDIPSRTDNLLEDLRQLAPDERGFLGIHYVRGEDGHIMKGEDGAPVKLVDLPQARLGKRRFQPDENPFDK